MGKGRKKLDDRIQHKQRDMLADYTHYDSEVYAPIARHGVFPDRGSEQFNVKSKYLDTYEVNKIKYIESSIPIRPLNV